MKITAIDLEMGAGSWIGEAAQQMVAMADQFECTVRCKFNDVDLVAEPHKSNGAAIVEAYNAETKRRHEEYRKSPEYKQRQEEQTRRQQEREATFDAALAQSPVQAQWKDQLKWEKHAEMNRDPYGACVVRYTEWWARLMEGQISRGATVAECAEEASRIADKEGITGFMYGCAVRILSQCWQFGEDLRRWHNLKTQIKDEGEKANESGGVLNPAILSISSLD